MKEAPSAVPIPTSLRSPPPAGSLRSAKPSWHRAARPNATVENKPRILVFVAGGMTYSEIREVYQLSTSLNKDIYIGKRLSSNPIAGSNFASGSTHVVTPRHFVDDLKVLELGGVGSRAIPNGLAESRGQRPYQEYYDDKYYTKDGPRPQPQPKAVAPTRTTTPKAPRLIPTISHDSSSSATSSVKEEKKKRKGLFKF